MEKEGPLVATSKKRYISLFDRARGCDYVLGSTMFFYFSLFGATRFRGRLRLGGAYILNNYGMFCLKS